MNKCYSLKYDFYFVVKIFLLTTIISFFLISFSEADKNKDKEVIPKLRKSLLAEEIVKRISKEIQ